MNKNNADSIRKQYVKINLQTRIDDISNKYFNDARDNGELNNIIKSLKKQGFDISMMPPKIQKTVFKFGVFQNIF